MTREEQLICLVDILAEHEITGKITEQTDMKHDLEMDSLDFVDIVFDILTVFGVKVEAREMGQLGTVGELLDYISAKQSAVLNKKQ